MIAVMPSESTLTSVSQRSSGIAYRCGRAAVVGGVLGSIWAWVASLVDSQRICSGWGCLPVTFLLIPLLVGLGALLASPFLRLVRVTPPWPVALLAPIAVWALRSLLGAVRLYVPVLGRPGVAEMALVAAVVCGYAVATLVTAVEIRARWRAALGVAVVALIPLGPLLQSFWVAGERAREISAYGHPLLAPDLPAYQIQGATAFGGSHPSFAYHLRLRAAGTAPADIMVVQTTVPAEFHPPADCRVDIDFVTTKPRPCVRVAENVWRTGTPPPNLTYLTQRGDQVVQLSTDTGVPETDLLSAASTLRVQPLAYFTDDGH